MLRQWNLAWRRPALLFLCAGTIYSWTALSFQASAWSVPSSPVSSAPGQDGKAQDGPEKDEKDKPNAKSTPAPPVVRWSEQQPGCTFSRGDDGKYRYGLWSGNAGIVLAVDAREVQIIRHRIEPLFGVLLKIRYRGAGSLDTSPDPSTLQFIKHYKVIQTALDPDDYTQKIQADADAVDDETRRDIEKHPEKRQALETRLQDYQKSVNELIEFLGKNTLQPAHLDPAHPEVSGWVFFNTKSKWLGGWKAQEEFVLRVPLDGKIFEFPFKLPPEKGELLLQKRQ
jgi:hypothetical protein